MHEDRQTRIKRLTMRSWRRGMREMDMILGPFAEANLATMTPTELDEFESILAENDQEIFAWITAKSAPAPQHAAQVSKIVGFLSERAGSPLN